MLEAVSPTVNGEALSRVPVSDGAKLGVIVGDMDGAKLGVIVGVTVGVFVGGRSSSISVGADVIALNVGVGVGELSVGASSESNAVLTTDGATVGYGSCVVSVGCGVSMSVIAALLRLLLLDLVGPHEGRFFEPSPFIVLPRPPF